MGKLKLLLAIIRAKNVIMIYDQGTETKGIEWQTDGYQTNKKLIKYALAEVVQQGARMTRK